MLREIDGNGVIALFFLVTLFFLSSDVYAQDSTEEEMTFALFRVDLRPQFDLIQQIFASGTITKGTNKKLKEFIKAQNVIPGGVVYFHSSGGSLFEAMAMGETIRAAGLNTNIGKQGPPMNLDIDADTEKFMLKAFGNIHAPEILSGKCLSACSLAYLGGVHRYWVENSLYGVHRFSTESEISDPINKTQIISGIVVKYIKDMGADPALYSLTTYKGSDDLVLIDKEDLISLQIITGSVIQEKWELKSIPEGIYLVGTKEDERGISKMMFQCTRSEKKLNVAALIPSPDENTAQRLLDDDLSPGYFIDNTVYRLHNKHGWQESRNFNEVQALWVAYPEDIKRITSAKNTTGFALLPFEDDDQIFFGFYINFGDEGKNLIRNYALDCWR